VDCTGQFVLTAQSLAPVSFNSDPVQLTEDDHGWSPSVTVQGSPDAVTGVMLTDSRVNPATFMGYFEKENFWEGFSSDYSFSGGGTGGAQLPILLNNSLYLAMNVSPAASRGQLSATFGMGQTADGTEPLVPWFL
jgi:hypothetical protein